MVFPPTHGCTALKSGCDPGAPSAYVVRAVADGSSDDGDSTRATEIGGDDNSDMVCRLCRAAVWTLALRCDGSGSLDSSRDKL